jgi:CheY-like chemotaxis protein
MSPETVAHIFEPFFTTKEVGKGTGLGLSMVYGTVEQAGGCIVVDSERGRGTTFRLYFPPARAAAAADPASAPPPPARPQLATVMVVDDQPQVRDIAAAALRRDGYRVLTASSGREALALAGAKGARLDLLLTDASMPEMGGRELASLMIETHPGLRVLVMSGYSAEALGMTGLERGIGVLPKPFTQAALRSRVRDLLATRNEVRSET